MLETLSAPGLQPFTFALFALVGLLVVELVLMLMGLSSDLGLGDAGLPDVDAGLAEIPHLPDAALAELDAGPALETAPATGAAPPFLRTLGLGDAPAMVWLAALAAGFAGSGFLLQGLAGSLFGAPLPTVAAGIIALVPGLWIARSVARLIGRLLPSVESYGTSSFHRREGRVTIGESRTGFPAEVRYLDSYGTSHHLMAEPLDPDDTIPAGSPVLILRDRAGRPRLVRLA